MTKTRVAISHDSDLDLVFECDGLARPMSAGACPRWRDADVAAQVLAAVLGEHGEVTHDDDTVIVVHFLDDAVETFTRDADGMFTVEGWTFFEPLLPGLPCETCGAAAQQRCAGDCATDEATRY